MVKHAYADESTVVATCGKDYRLSLSSLPSTPITTPPSSPRQQIFIGSFAKKMSNNKKKAIDYTISKYMHINGGSYSLFKSLHDKAVIQALSPAYMQAGGPPDKDVVSGQHLTRHNLEVMSRVIGLITTTLSVGVSTDGWTNIRSNGLHNFMVGNPIPYLLKSVRTLSSNEDVNTLYGITNDMKSQITVMYLQGKKDLPIFIALCNDSPNNNKGVRLKIIADLRTNSSKTVPLLIGYSCCYHGLNNVGNDICKLFGLLPKVLAQTRLIAAVFRNTKFPRYHLQMEQVRMFSTTRQLNMPVATRWNTNLTMLTSVLRSKDALRNVCMKARYDDLEPSIDLCAEFSGRNSAGLDDCQVSNAFKLFRSEYIYLTPFFCITFQSSNQVSCAEVIEDASYWKRLEQAIQLLSPVASSVTYLEGDTSPISSVPALFIKHLRSYKKLSTKADDATFMFSSIGLGPRDFQDKKDSRNKKGLPDLLRR